MKKFLFIVAADQVDLLPELSREFAREGVIFVVDRREHPRRQMPIPVANELRSKSRRQRCLCGLLAELGFAVVPRD